MRRAGDHRHARAGARADPAGADLRARSLRLGGGVLIASAGAGWAFVLDAATFAASAACVARMRSGGAIYGEPAAPLRAALDGLAYVRSQTWLWATFLGTTV